MSGVNEKHISKIETGVYFPRYKTLLKLVKPLGLNEDNIEFDINTVKIEYKSNLVSPYADSSSGSS